ncbi:MAG: hypothetical protein ISS15_05430 [Alphaproteobacteria bacterium]|nr:hypothetical protein [Alphaproteobacteria bacterium]MBL6939438.1 hypothetical protein [Alphaproteobacteria bacterium]MBL7097081.1 hypothetical protein [Alphaproteobacteria bacterium]
MTAQPLPQALRATKANAFLCARIGVLIDGVDMGKRVLAYDASIGWASLTDGSTVRGVVVPYWRHEGPEQIAQSLGYLRTLYDEVMGVYLGSNGDKTKALYQRLNALGPVGFVASNLFRACKCSERAKDYRRGSQKREAYRRKQWSLDNLDGVRCCSNMAQRSGSSGAGRPIRRRNSTSKCSMSSSRPARLAFTPRRAATARIFVGAWDGVRGEAPERICRWVVQVLEGAAA